jgi:single-strand DNA-binding protein
VIQAFVAGNLGRDAETRTAGRDTVCSFSVASSRKAKGEEQTTWIRCSLWGKRGEALAKFLTKGSKVAVSGELSLHEYDGKTYLELRVAEIELMGGNKPASSRRDEPRDEEPAPSGAGATDDDDIPFAPIGDFG